MCKSFSKQSDAVRVNQDLKAKVDALNNPTNLVPGTNTTKTHVPLRRGGLPVARQDDVQQGRQLTDPQTH